MSYSIKRFSNYSSKESYYEDIVGKKIPDQYYKLIDLEKKYNLRLILKGSPKWTGWTNIPSTVYSRDGIDDLDSINDTLNTEDTGNVALLMDDNSIIYWNSRTGKFNIDEGKDQYNTLKDALLALLDSNIEDADSSKSSISSGKSFLSIFKKPATSQVDAINESIKLMTDYRGYIDRNLR